MNKAEVINHISDSYSPLTPTCKGDLLNKSRFVTPTKNTILVKEKQYSDKSFYIVKGCARAYYLNDGKDISDWFAFEGDFISSIQSFFLGVPSPHYIEVLEDSILLEISRESADELSNKHHDFERLTKNVAIKTMLQQQERIVAIQFQSAEQRYQNIISLRSDITQRVPLTHIASYIGITLETLSRIRKSQSRI
ncbi:cAMP-binding protein [Roseivirga seohaensis subsp. aquiponti]|uniref:cAMP-binding protein n=2 Tax=Roseivirga seohaensis TaxID=1914963 RepID=A0A0L8AQH4_9BACT|nr:cAMP-binding protein [Roseivirga seohaensis subsp. aquiponti]|tara:strand:+ start:854 stop:1435 length:582 start_codon:yes stop_codon:yes gene_type:complete